MHFVGSCCAGNGVCLHVFEGSACSKKALNDVCSKQTGCNLPTDSLVSKDCTDCSAANNDNNDGDSDNNDAVLEGCDDLHDCRKGLLLSAAVVEMCCFCKLMLRDVLDQIDCSLRLGVVFCCA